MKVRIGFGLGTRTITNRPETFDPLVDSMEDLGFDSLWLSERLGGACPDPLVGMAYAAGRTSRIKFGMSVMVLPGRNPAVLAKALASLDRLSGGRLLPAFGLGVADRHEQQAFGVERTERAAWFDEALPLLRRFWTEDGVTHHGARFHYEDVAIEPKPVQDDGLEVRLGGAAPAQLRRCGRLGDGSLPSFTTPQVAAEGWDAINAAAAEAGRVIDPEHFGALVPCTHDDIDTATLDLLHRRAPGIDPGDIIPTGHRGLRDLLERFTDVGASKFVPVLIGEPDDWRAELESLASAVLPLHN